MSLTIIITYAQFSKVGSLPTGFPASHRNTSTACSRVHGSLTRTVVEILHEPITRRSHCRGNSKSRTALAFASPRFAYLLASSRLVPPCLASCQRRPMQSCPVYRQFSAGGDQIHKLSRERKSHILKRFTSARYNFLLFEQSRVRLEHVLFHVDCSGRVPREFFAFSLSLSNFNST